MAPKDYLARIFSGEIHHLDKLAGYTDDEIRTIEAKLNISVRGELREFLRHVGRCAGHLFSDSLVLYCEISADMIGYQKDCLDDLVEEHRANPADIDGYFMFSSESEGYHHWVKTKQDDFERVYIENEEGLTDTGKTLLQYLQWLAPISDYDNPIGVLVEGDMFANCRKTQGNVT